jgi:hypothetical protein
MIASLNLDGVALAAIQGPHQVMRRQMLQKDEEIAGLKQELQAVKATVSRGNRASIARRLGSRIPRCICRGTSRRSCRRVEASRSL